jgi:hypothetical protein
MNQEAVKTAEVFFHIESSDGKTSRLTMSLAYNNSDDMQISIGWDELTMLQGLYALSPDKFRRLMNNLVDEAYQAGFRHATEDAEANDAVLMGN